MQDLKTFGSICSGVGMQEIAIKKVYPGIELKFYSEIDKYAIKSFEAIHGQIKNLGDFTKELYPEHVDFLFGSTPCQDFSMAGKQKGFEGFKGSLTYEFIEFIKRMEEKPKVIGFENVTGLLQEKFKEGYVMFKNEFKNLGYKVNEFELNSIDYGILQNRPRIFLLITLENLVIKYPKKLKKIISKNHYGYDIRTREFKVQGWVNYVPCLCARDYKSPKVKNINGNIERLTPKEYWNFMGISEENFCKAQHVNSNSQLYKQAGNGIVVDVLVALFLELKNSYIEEQSFEVVGNTIAYTLF